MNIRDYLMTKEAAKFLGVRPNTLRKWTKDGKFKERRHPITGYRLYKKEELKKFLDRIERSWERTLDSLKRKTDL